MRLIIIITILIGFLNAEPRYALLIGNSHYKYIDNLQNPIPNLKKLKRVLENLGFEVEEIKRDLDSAELFETIEKFSKKLAINRDSIGFVYYSGHGCQLNYQGYLVPIDVDTKNRVKIKHHALSVNELLDTLSTANNRVNMVFLDACRDVPIGAKGGKKGLGQPTATPKGSLVVYATEAGKTADDNSNFINALISNIQKPNQDIKEIADSISNSVADKTNENQIPVVFYKRLPKVVLRKGDTTKKKWNSLIYRRKRSYSKNSENTVKDNYTGLIWQKSGSDKKMTWEEAKRYCKDLVLDGYSNWRLPTEKELYYLADRTKINPAIDTNYFDIKSDFYWSATTYKNGSSGSWNVYFRNGNDYWDFKSDKGYVLCAR